MSRRRVISFLVAIMVVFGSFMITSSNVKAALYDSDSAVPSFTDIEVVDGGVRFTWNKVENSNCPNGVFYRIYYKNIYGSWVRMITTASTHFIDTDVHIGKSFTYTIRCVSPEDGSFASDYNDAGWTVTYYDAPVINSVNRTYTDGISRDTITWSGSAPSYRVYCKYMNQSGLNVVSQSTTSKTFTIRNKSNGIPYAYKVCALDEYGEVASECADTPYYQNSAIYSSRNRWIYELLSAKYDEIAERDFSEYTYSDLSYYAHYYGALTPTGYFNDGVSLTRQFTADTLMNLFKYKAHSLANHYNTAYNNPMGFTRIDRYNYYAVDTTNRNINTVAYYGWIEPSFSNMLSPYKDITSDEWDELMQELSLYRTWHGKTVISFGDSGMQGRGNVVNKNGGSSESSWRDINRSDFANKRYPRFNKEIMEGPVEYIGEKYGMIHRDYSWSGAAMGTELTKSGSDYVFTNGASYKSHIANQIRTALKEGQKADLILMNGGDNDPTFPTIPFSYVSGNRNVYDWGYSAPDWFSEASHRDYHNINQQYFHYNDQKVLEDYTQETSLIGGATTAFNLLYDNYPNVPVIYVRSHQIEYGSLTYQRVYQEKVMSLASSYGYKNVDLFNLSDLDGYNKRMILRYCCDGASNGYMVSYGIHPTGLGYSKYYLPFIEDVLSEI